MIISQKIIDSIDFEFFNLMIMKIQLSGITSEVHGNKVMFTVDSNKMNDADHMTRTKMIFATA